jgi:two-component system sensor histidine kinase YesM
MFGSLQESSLKPAVVAVNLLLALLASYIFYQAIYKPYRETERMLSLVIDGYTLANIDTLRYPYTLGMDGALKTLKAMLDSKELIASSQNLAQYLALQNQINPHFLYNTLEGIRGEAIEGGLDNVATMVETLALYFRYATTNTEQLVTLEDELENINNYYRIQQFRFGPKIQLEVKYDEGDRDLLYKCRLPKITLQPIVENAIIHGIERKIEPGCIIIKIVSTEKLLRITISDDGVGMDEASLSSITQMLSKATYQSASRSEGNGRGIAIVNVNNRIRLLFGEEYGLTVYSVLNMGTDVEITLPLKTGRVGDPLF